MKTMQTQDLDIHNKNKKYAVLLPISLVVFFFAALFLLHLYTAQEYTTQDSLVGGSITGAETLEKEPSFETTLDPQIGVYMIKPSFSFVDQYQLTNAFTHLQREIRTFTETVQECQQENPLEACLSSTLKDPSYAAWSRAEDCETPEERLFYDVTEMFRTCLESVDTDCVCLGSFVVPAQYPSGEYTLNVAQEDTGVSFSLSGTEISTVIPSMAFQVEGEEEANAEYTLAVTEDHVLGQFSILESSSMVYLYKPDATTTSVESQRSYSTYETTRTACELPEEKMYKFCVQSSTAVQVYDESQKTVITRPLPYTFVLDFK